MDTNFVGTLAVTQAMLSLLRLSPAARIVNLSSSLGSLAVNGDPTSPYYAARLIGYNASKAAVNMLTVQLAAELGDTSIVVNSVSPGYVKTDLTGHNGYMTPEEGAKLPVEYALLGADAVSGQFVEPGGADTLVSLPDGSKQGVSPNPFVLGKAGAAYLIAALSFLAISP